MDKSLNNKVEICLYVTPLYSLFGGVGLRFRLSDFSYGEWLIFEYGKPKYYFNIFDPLYIEFLKMVENQTNLESILERKLKAQSPALSLKNKVIGIPSLNKSYKEVFILEKIPNTFLL